MDFDAVCEELCPLAANHADRTIVRRFALQHLDEWSWCIEDELLAGHHSVQIEEPDRIAAEVGAVLDSATCVQCTGISERLGLIRQVVLTHSPPQCVA